ncbi:hypothetical protein NP493_89g05016 [Ridgeia piscesae]|uniref:IPT/TIG domain-containing protein n=1 Tax=Ridgeia piscesae TaxID=27915 RepID=A0AAD9P8H1_RIDPI|nr:hypothetical protein NP493_89g05016 [Ridgeia piscesae]
MVKQTSRKKPKKKRTPEDKGKVRITPDRGPSLGGITVTVSGLNFKKSVHCRFDKVVVTGNVRKGNKKAFCVAPMFARVGVVKVDVSVDGGRTYLPGIDYKLDADAAN